MKSSRASLAMRGGIVATLLTSMLMAFAVILSPVQSAWAVGLGVETTSESDIRSYASSHDIDLDRLLTTSATYEEQPDYQNAPYAPGKLSQATENDALAFVNFARYVAGLSSDVKLNENYSAKAQASALVNCINGSLSHEPSMPSGISDELYRMGKEGSSSSNIAWGYPCIADSVLGYLEDSDDSNISRVGHRRWVLNPLMKEVGFGKVGLYSAMYAHDNPPYTSCDTIVSWPAQHMPRELFGDRVAWSLTVGKEISSPSNVSVTLTRRSDGATWRFGSSGRDGDFYVDNGWYAQPGCIIFRPDDVSYNAGDTFDVTITGATSQTISYSVTFFDLVPKKTQVISCQDSYVVSEAEEGFWLDANVLGDAWLSYSSSDEDVVSVESNGHVIINGPGTAVITLTADETDDYASATKQVTVTVKVANGRYVNLPTNLEHGKVSVSPDGPIAKGATVTINLLPDELYKVEAVSAVDAYGNPVPISGNGDTRTFVMPDADVTLSVSFIESTAQMRGVGFYRTAEPKNGTVIVEGGEFQAVGSTVTLVSVPDEGYELDSISAMNCITNEYLTLSGTGDTRTFVMPDADVAIFVSFAEVEEDDPAIFPDVSADDWYFGPVEWAVETGLMGGKADGTFAPGEKLSRAQLAVVLWNRAGNPSADPSAADAFVDTDPSGFYAGALNWCVENGYFMGLDSAHFSPSTSMTRESLAVVLWRMADYPESSYDLSRFPDGDRVSSYAGTAVRWAVENGIISGQGNGTLDPQGAIDRAQCAAIFQRLASK